MSTIFGVLSKAGAKVPQQWMDSMKEGGDDWIPDSVGIHYYSNIGLGCLQLCVTPESVGSEQPCVDPNSGAEIVFDGRLDNRKALQETLGLEVTETDADYVLAAYNKWGSVLCSHLVGDFAFAIWDPQIRRLLLARDHLGMRPLFLAETNEYIAFSSDKHCLLALPWVDRSVDEQWIADYLSITKVSKTSTYYRAISSFEPAHCMQWDEGRSTKNQYWRLDAEREIYLLSDDEYNEKFRFLLKEAVHCRLRGVGEVASELSGGLDSTLIASLASRMLEGSGQSFASYSHVLAPELEGKVYPFVDEKKWISELCSFAGIEQHVPIYSRGRGALQAFEHSVKIHAGPNRSDLTMLGDELLDTLEQSNTRVLLSGFGGDQLVSCGVPSFFSTLANERQYFDLWRELGFHHAGVLRRVRSFGASCMRGPIDRLKNGKSIWDNRKGKLLANCEFLESHGYPDRFLEHPTRPSNSLSARHWQTKVLESPHMLYRLEDSAIGAAARRVEYRYPLLDIRLLEFVLALPLFQKRRSGQGRRMVRVATKGILPDILRNRADKSKATVPTTWHRLAGDKAKFEAFLRASKNQNSVNYLDRVKLDRFVGGLNPIEPHDFSEQQKSFHRAIQLLAGEVQ